MRGADSVWAATAVWCCLAAFAYNGESSVPEKGNTTMMDPDFAAMIRPLPAAAKFSDPECYIWCGTMVRGDDGKCHLYYSRWPRKLGHNAWVTRSEVAHAAASRQRCRRAACRATSGPASRLRVAVVAYSVVSSNQ